MIRDEKSTEFIRVPLPPIQRTAEEIGQLLIAAIDKSHVLTREKQAVIESYRVKQEAIGKEIAMLIREAKDGPQERHEDVACNVWYNLETRERILVRKDRVFHVDPVQVHEENVISRRPMTPQEIQEFGGAMVQDTVL